MAAAGGFDSDMGPHAYPSTPGGSAGMLQPLQLTSAGNHVEAFTSPLAIPPVLTGTSITLEAREASLQILPGPATTVWGYNGIFPGPTIRRPTGQTTNITLINSLSSAAGSLTLHNHGNHSSPDNDGQANNLLVPPGASRTYAYDGLEDGGNERGTMQFYHDHRMDVTARNLWMGLAGLYIIDDPADPASLPSGDFEIPLVIVDRAFDANNQLIYQFSPGGVVGDTILVNGVVQPYLEVADRKYRFRILNAANFSQYDLQLSNGQTMTQVGTESGLLPAPTSRTNVLLGPAERGDVVIDFAGLLGQNIELNNLAGSGSTGQVMQFRVTRHETDTSSVPSSLRSLPVLGSPVLTRTFDFGLTNGVWTINGLGYDPDRIDAYPVLGTTEKWILHNASSASHVIHIHDVDQQLVSRNGQPPAPYELIKESWNISGNQTVEILIRFTDHTGLYVFHCHLVEHEDDRMMMQIDVVTTPVTPTNTLTRTNTPSGPTPTATITRTPSLTPTPACTPTLVGVSIGDNYFSPDTITISAGTAVRWTNIGRRDHSATSNTNVWDSGILAPGQSFDFTFNSVGTYNYYCVIHGGMTGTVIVVPCAPPSATPTPSYTRTPTATPSVTSTVTRTPTNSPTQTLTNTPTGTPSSTRTGTATYTSTSAPTNTNSPTTTTAPSATFAATSTGTSSPTTTRTPTGTNTPTATPAGVLIGHVTLQGVSQPSTRNIEPITLTLCVAGSPEDFVQNLDQEGFFTVTTGLAPGAYNFRAKPYRSLATAGTVTLQSGTTNIDFAPSTDPLKGGDCNNSNTINSTDFNILKNGFGSSTNPFSDINNDGVTNSVDFNILKGNFGQSGGALVCP